MQAKAAEKPPLLSSLKSFSRSGEVAENPLALSTAGSVGTAMQAKAAEKPPLLSTHKSVSRPGDKPPRLSSIASVGSAASWVSPELSTSESHHLSGISARGTLDLSLSTSSIIGDSEEATPQTPRLMLAGHASQSKLRQEEGDDMTFGGLQRMLKQLSSCDVEHNERLKSLMGSQHLLDEEIGNMKKENLMEKMESLQHTVIGDLILLQLHPPPPHPSPPLPAPPYPSRVVGGGWWVVSGKW